MSRFQALEAKLAAQGAADPAGLAAYIGKKKYGRAEFKAMAAAGRKVKGRAAEFSGEVRAVPFEMDKTGDGLTFEGYAAVYDTPTRIDARGGAFDEVIRPGAFRSALSKQTPVLMFDHGKHPLIGTMPLGVITRTAEDSKGLHIEARLSDNWLIQPVRDAVRDQAVKGMSFRFTVDGGDSWQERRGQPDLRAIHDFATVPELGPVVFPAYEPTTATVRSLVERLPDLTGRPVARSAGGGDLGSSRAARSSQEELAARFAKDTDALALLRKVYR